MKNFKFILIAGLSFAALSGCSSEEGITEENSGSIEAAFENDTGNGKLEILTSNITADSNEIEIKMQDIDESKPAFITIANETVNEGTVENDTVYTFSIDDIRDAKRTDYKPKIQLIQTDNDKLDGDIVTFKEVRYSVKK